MQAEGKRPIPDHDLSGPVTEVLLVLQGDEDWESHLIQGALWYVGVRTRIVHELAQLPDHFDICITIPHLQPDGGLTRLQQTPGTVILVGNAVTNCYYSGSLSAAANEITVVGEPYTLLQQLSLSREMRLESLGKILVSPLFDLLRYRSPLRHMNNSVPILTSLGCMKKCGYCSHGYNNRCLYGDGFVRRSRRGRDLASEITAASEDGNEHFVLIADQFLAGSPEDNTDLFELAAAMPDKGRAKPVLEFTVSPLEVIANRPLLQRLASCFSLYPHLSVDSFDDDTLKLLDLEHDGATALDAVDILSSLQLPIRLNYLFIRPGASIEAIQGEFACFEALAVTTAHLDPLQRLMLAYDLFSRRLLLSPRMPVSAREDIAPDYWQRLPAAQFRILESVNAILGTQFQQLSSINSTAGATVPTPLIDALTACIEVGLKKLLRGSWGGRRGHVCKIDKI